MTTFILRSCGLAEQGYQPKALNRRVAACLRTLSSPSEQEAIVALRRKPELLGLSLNALLIGVSGFFRDKGVFEELRQMVRPWALDRERALRVYSAGCSSGQELYSVAMLLDELHCLDRSHLLGVDCRPDAIAQARSGNFLVSELEGLEMARRERYFRLEGRHAAVWSGLKHRTRWRVADLSLFAEAECWDLILFRNVAIYLEPEYSQGIWRRLDRQLKPGGILVTGPAERPPEDLPWTRESACLYRKATLAS